MNWQPIETAPKDGSEILLSVKYPAPKHSKEYRLTELGEYVLKSKHQSGCFMLAGDNPLFLGKPTHWMPVPQYVDPKTEP